MRPSPVLDVLYRCLLRVAALLVPAHQRAEWLREWCSELWHVRRSHLSGSDSSFNGEQEIAAFCFGAFQDAFCIRQHAWRKGRSVAMAKGSAARCLLLLGTVLATSYCVALLAPGVRGEREKDLYQLRHQLVLVRSALASNNSVPSIGAGQFRLWKNRGRHLFDGLAFYQIDQQSVSQVTRSALSIANASPNLFKLLGVPLRFVVPENERQIAGPTLVLSDELWSRDFGSDPSIVGQIVSVGEQEVRVVGVAPAGFHVLPGKIDAWLLEPNDNLFTDSPGFVVAHVSPYEVRELWA